MRTIIALSSLCLLVACTLAPRQPVAVDPSLEAEFASEVVAADHPLASQAGAEILRMGGNAVDAAVATSLALSVVRPVSCGIGGGGFMVIAMPGDPVHGRVLTAFDYRERAPALVTETFFEGEPAEASQFSGKAVAIPGTVAGLAAAHEAFGVLEWADVCRPAIRLAEQGWRVDAHTIRYSRELEAFHASRDGADPFMASRYEGLRAGSVIDNPEQAAALRLIADYGRDGFYQGPVARAIVASVRARGGVLSREDLLAYEPKRVDPVVGGAFGRTVVAMPLPSSGGVTMLAALGILEARRELWEGAGSPADPLYTHVLLESLKHAFAGRASYLGDPEFDEIPVELMLSEREIESRAVRVHPRRTFRAPFYAPGDAVADDAGTSHVSIVDKWGNAVSMTETINLAWGARFTAEGYGFALNNEMDDFLARRGTVNAFGLVQSERNLPEAGKRPLSSMSPTIVLDSETGEVLLVAGASGGPRIITGTLQAVLNALVFEMDTDSAVAEPRVHHQWLPDAAFVETKASRGGAFSTRLREFGHAVREREDIGAVQLVRRVPGGWQASSDPRKGGAPAGR